MKAFSLFCACLATLQAATAFGQSTAAAQGKKYALLVGVRQYDQNELRSLPFSEADVTELGRVLKEAEYLPDNVVLMTQTLGAENSRYLPLAANIRKELRLLLRNRGRGDTVLIALAGHGVQFKKNADQYFCPMDAQLSDKNTLISIGEIYKELEKCHASVRLLLVDACRNNPQTERARSAGEVEIESVTRPPAQEPPGGVAALFSCKGGEKAFEHEELRHGVFFHFIIEGLRGKADADHDRKVDLDELMLYAKKQVPEYVRTKLGAVQTPENRGLTAGVVPIINLDKLRRAALGITAGVWEIVPKEIHEKMPPGYLIEGVHAGSAAEKAGLKAGDVIVAVEGHPLKNNSELASILLPFGPGSEVSLNVWRDGKVETRKCSLEERADAARTAQAYRKEADEGKPWAQRNLARFYRDGEGIPQNDGEAAKWFRKAAEQGDAQAQNSLAWLYQRGRGVPADQAQAFEWYKKAADTGYRIAQNHLASMYELGKGTTKDIAEAARWRQKSAENGYASAQYNLARIYLSGQGVSRNEQEAMKWAQKAAAQNYPPALRLCGRMFERGQGAPKDSAKAVEWYRKAVEHGYPQAYSDLAPYYLTGKDVAKDTAEAVRLYQEGADLRDAKSQDQLGVIYEEGKLAPKNLVEAANLYRAAAEANQLEAQYRLGSCLAAGRGVAKNETEAVRWYRKAADRGHSRACLALAICYRDGKTGVGQSDAEALKWSRKAAEKGLASGQYLLGSLLEQGRGTQKNLKEATSWYRKAAAQNDPQAKARLAELTKKSSK